MHRGVRVRVWSCVLCESLCVCVSVSACLCMSAHVVCFVYACVYKCVFMCVCTGVYVSSLYKSVSACVHLCRAVGMCTQGGRVPGKSSVTEVGSRQPSSICSES